MPYNQIIQTACCCLSQWHTAGVMREAFGPSTNSSVLLHHLCIHRPLAACQKLARIPSSQGGKLQAHCKLPGRGALSRMAETQACDVQQTCGHCGVR